MNLKFAEPGEKSCYRIGNISFFDKICLSNAAKYPYFPSKKVSVHKKKRKKKSNCKFSSTFQSESALGRLTLKLLRFQKSKKMKK